MQNIKNYKFIEELKLLPFVKEVWLYGSRARGYNEEKSDIDLAIICNENYDSSKITEIIENADTLLEIDYIDFNKLKDNKFKERVRKEKVVL
ncbi:MAG TPA: nucleotidyltransferase domain-containing protein [Rickettsiales bacterium]|nr:nucleotidyltransferase domain-containing protein [Rickettsiales bacterium]